MVCIYLSCFFFSKVRVLFYLVSNFLLINFSYSFSPFFCSFVNLLIAFFSLLLTFLNPFGLIEPDLVQHLQPLCSVLQVAAEPTREDACKGCSIACRFHARCNFLHLGAKGPGSSHLRVKKET